MQNLLTNLATLKVYWDQSDTDLLSNFMPLVGYAIKTLPNRVVSEEELVERIYQVAEFKIPRAAANILIRRASRTKYGFINKEAGSYVRNDAAVAHLDFEVIRLGISQKFQTLGDRFSAYIAETFPNAPREVDPQYYFFDILYDLTPRLIQNLYDAEKSQTFDRIVEDNKAEYRVSRFVDHCFQHDPDSYDLIISFAQGAILSESFFYSNPETVTTKLRNTKVYFDTSIVLTLLGYADEVFRTTHLELHEILVSMNAKLAIFDVTLKEIKRIFLAAENARLGSARYTPFRPGDVFDHFIRNNYSPSDIRLEAEKLESKLENLGISVEAPPPHTVSLGIDEIQLNDYLNKYFGSDLPPSNASRMHDVDCASAIYRLRGGLPQRYFESCKAIFVTGNVELVRAVNEYFRREFKLVSDAPIMIGDRVFTMLMWLKAVDKKPALPRQQLVANSLAAMSPSQKLWDKFLTETQRLAARGELSQNDYNIMAYSLEARTALMAITEGDQSVVTEGSLIDVLSRSKELILTETRRDYEIRLNAQSTILRNLDQTISKIEKLTSLTIKWTSIGALMAVMMAGLLLTDPATALGTIKSKTIDYVRLSLLAAFCSLLLATVANLFFGVTLENIVDGFATKIARRLRLKLNEVFRGEDGRKKTISHDEGKG
ncbi:hypothetical protein [uncultured Bradyrhizobium sp.]|jgi:hypothetical protein|uniref:hypothetical protein n=1 Tax=uncultured Bradyrhizobium sp. TaxID=199684 RepID=UPI0026398DCC|nr:hypothetical protein [uncultured Bradyrhizobium sp.]